MVKLKVRLEILSKEDMKDLENDVMNLENLSERKRVASGKAGKRTPRSKGSGIFASESGEDALPSSIIKKRRKALNDRRIESNLGTKGESAGVSNTGAPIQKLNAFKELQKKVSKNEKATKLLSKGLGGFNQFGALTGSAGGLTSLGVGLASKILPVSVLLAIAKLSFDIWASSYGDGAVNDPRKKVLNDIRSFIGLERETDIISGKQFFANSRTLKQGQDIRTNTMNLVDGYTLSKLNRSGYGR